jgi:hypothetical protein
MYILKKDFLDENFFEPTKLLKVSMFALFFLFAINLLSGLPTAMYFGYPDIKIMNLPMEQRAIWVMVVILNLLFMFLVSSWCYFQILKCRSPLGNNIVGVINDTEASPANNGLFLIENVHQEVSAKENKDIENFARIQRQAEIMKRQAEKDSAVLSLETNLSFFFVLILLFLLATFLSNDEVSIIFSLIKSQAPVVTSIINFVKIRTLMINFYHECAAVFLLYKNKLCCK